MSWKSTVASGGIAAAALGLVVIANVQSQERSADVEEALRHAYQLSDAFEHAAERINRSVVSISAVSRPDARTQGRTRGGNPFAGSPFEGLFDDRMMEMFNGQPMPPRQGLGSGFVVDRAGHVLTNNHVVRDATEIRVTLWNGESFLAEVVGGDPSTDLAVLEIDADRELLQPVRFGDSDDLRVGEWVVAAGNPYNLSSTITAGIISAKGRSGVGVSDYENFIQTDAAINPGNSGGPLVNLRGDVVGVNTAIYTQNGGSMGIGFAIPANMAKSVMRSLVDNGEVVRGWLGVMIQDMTPSMARSFGYQGEDGVVVSEVVEGSPAEAAGLQPEDIITHFAGQEITTVDQLRNKVAVIPPGRNVPVDLVRDGREMAVTVAIGVLPDTAGANPLTRPPSEPNMDQELGMAFQDLTPELARKLNLDSTSGVVVTRVEPLGIANRGGIRAGDIIVKVHGERVRDARELQRELGKHNLRDGIRLSVRSGGANRFIFLQKR